MIRSLLPELMDAPDFPASKLAEVHRDLAKIHRLLGTFSTIERIILKDKALKDKATKVASTRILDIGCGDGALLRYLRNATNAEVIGVEPAPIPSDIPIVAADATIDPLPEADVAICVLTSHHLTPEQNIAMIRNVGRSCPRFIILDLIRHPLPLTLFTLFVAPWIGPISAADGQQSIRRAFTPREFHELASMALEGTQSTFTIDVPRWLSRQIVDIHYK